MRIKIRELEELTKKILKTKYDENEVNLIAEVIMFGELSGKQSHGILRLLKENYGAFVDGIKGKPEFIKKSKISTLIDGKGNVGMLVGSLAMNEVLRLAKKNDIGIVGTKNSFNSTGSLSYYCEKIAKEDLIALIFTQCSPIIAPFKSVKALFGTNPIAFGFPSMKNPLVFDMSTSAITFGAIAKLKSENKLLPENVAIDRQGNITQNPIEAMEGATLPFDNSYKGSGLAMIVEILGALWSGASFGGINSEDGWGNLYLAISPNLLSDLKTFKEKTENLVKELKKAPTVDGKQIRIPGENTFKIREENIKKGELEVNEDIVKKIKNQLAG